MSVYKPVYASPVAITCTLANLAASATVGRSCAVIDNTVNLYEDISVFLGITTGSAALGTNPSVNVYVFAQDGAGNYEQEEGNPPGTDASYTINANTIFRTATVFPVANSSKYYQRSFTLGNIFGGIIPPKWGLIVVNNTGAAFAASGFLFEYIGINYTYG